MGEGGWVMSRRRLKLSDRQVFQLIDRAGGQLYGRESSPYGRGFREVRTVNSR